MTNLDGSNAAAPTPARPVVLCILDGWGYREEREDNAIVQARTPTWDRLWEECPHALLDASEHEVGLPAGQMGNSEVGHMNIGAGRVVLQDLPRIDEALEQDAVRNIPAYRTFVAALKKSGGTAQVLGLLSPGGVHSHQRHFAALVRMLSADGISVVIHAFLDGRDTPPKSARGYVEAFLGDIDGAAGVRFGTISGRYWAMDRDKRWERIEPAYNALVRADGPREATPLAAIDAAYARDETDEFVRPTVIGDFAGMTDGDGVLMVNFRSDRARQLLTALLEPHFDGFSRGARIAFAAALGMTSYSEVLDGFMDTLFPPQPLKSVLGEVVAKAGRTQLRIAETEKYAHVTFFLNGGEERSFPGEERILVPSPKVATYDLKPEMSAPAVTDKLVEAIKSGRFDLIVVNYANTDMVGHTGDIRAAIKAVEAVDACLARLDAAVVDAGGALLITADHGNAEKMRDDKAGQPHTAHTSSAVPVILSSAAAGAVALRDGRLADVAPTVLALMGIDQPAEMTGRSLMAPASKREFGMERSAGERRAATG